MEGLNVRYARDKIASYLIHKAIEENVGGGISPPSLEYQVHQFYGHDGAIARFKTEKRVVTTKDGQERTVEVPRIPVRSGSGGGDRGNQYTGGKHSNGIVASETPKPGNSRQCIEERLRREAKTTS